MQTFLLLIGTCAALLSIVPLMIWAGSGSWRAALHALKVYLQILGGLAVAGGGLGLIMAFAQHGWALFS